MEIASENLFPDESDASEDLKLVRLARAFRLAAMTKPQSSVMLIGLLSHKLTDPASANAMIGALVVRMRRAKDKLISFGVFNEVISGYVPLVQAPVVADVVVVTARDEPGSNPYKGIDFYTLDDVISDSVATPDPTQVVTAKGVVDPFDDGGASMVVQLEISVFDALGTKSRLPGETKFTMKIEQNTLKEVGLEWTPLKAELRKKMFWGTIQKVEISATIAAKSDMTKVSVQNMFGKWSNETKASLEADVKIPKTSIKIHVEGSLKTDFAGKPKAGVEFSWDF